MDAGIRCHLRKTEPTISGYETHAELWVDNAQDCRRAMRLCAQRKIGLGHQSGRQNSPIPAWRDAGRDQELACNQ